MAAPEDDPEPEILTVDETARFLRIAKVTLSTWRASGRGPAHCKCGSRVLYRRSVLRDWLRSCERVQATRPTGPKSA
jgi:hypothetical protein